MTLGSGQGRVTLPFHHDADDVIDGDRGIPGWTPDS